MSDFMLPDTGDRVTYRIGYAVARWPIARGYSGEIIAGGYATQRGEVVELDADDLPGFVLARVAWDRGREEWIDRRNLVVLRYVNLDAYRFRRETQVGMMYDR